MIKEKKSSSRKPQTNNSPSTEKLDKKSTFSQKKRSFAQSPDLKKLKQKYQQRASFSLRKKSQQSQRRQISHRYSPELQDKYTIDVSTLKKYKKNSQNQQIKLPSINKRLNQYQTIKLRQVQKIKHRNYSYDFAISQDAQKVKLEISKNQKKQYPVSIRTKAGCNGNMMKINQDLDIVTQKLPFGIKLFCICDGHGTNGHLVTAFIRKKLLSRKFKNYVSKFETNLVLTTGALFDHNQDEYNVTLNRILCFNVGDSRAILIDYFKYGGWKTVQISNDHKPQRKDEAKRILAAGGRIQQQMNQKKQYVGPMRVWMKDLNSPGLAMTRSFGDKAGNRAGTIPQPQVTQFLINPWNKYLLIASDGIWQHLENHQVVKLMQNELKQQLLQQAADKLLNSAVDIWTDVCSSRDDITFIIVKLNPIDVPGYEQ